MKKRKTILDDLRDEIRKAEKLGITQYRLAQLSGVTEATISRLRAGKLGTVRVSTLENLAEALELRITLDKRE